MGKEISLHQAILEHCLNMAHSGLRNEAQLFFAFYCLQRSAHADEVIPLLNLMEEAEDE